MGFTDGRTADPPHAISQAFERIAGRAGVPTIRLHDLRHTHGTLLINAGMTERRVRRARLIVAELGRFPNLKSRAANPVPPVVTPR